MVDRTVRLKCPHRTRFEVSWLMFWSLLIREGAAVHVGLLPSAHCRSFL
jgi:hypothetical protein